MHLLEEQRARGALPEQFVRQVRRAAAREAAAAQRRAAGAPMKKYLEVALGIFTSIGGFLEVGAIATTAQAGAQFGFRLAWVLLLGTICVIFLVEMSGRLSAVSKHTLQDAMRERFGAGFFLVSTIPGMVVDWLVLASEIGGVALALQLVTGISYQWWAFPVAIAAWLLLWKGNLGLVENGTALLGLVALSFIVAAVRLHPPLHDLAAGLVPSFPASDGASYWFLAVSILGALISPYLFFFYSSGAIEDQWDENHIGSNRFTAIVGMSFGAVLAFGVLVAAAMVFYPRGIQVDRYEQVALMLTEALGRPDCTCSRARSGSPASGRVSRWRWAEPTSSRRDSAGTTPSTRNRPTRRASAWSTRR